MLKVINCKNMFSKIGINEFKNNIADYHQGFMIIDGDLYIPYYRALQLGLDFDGTYVSILDNYDNVTARDIVASEFGTTDLDEVVIMDLAEVLYNNDYPNLSRLVDVVADLYTDTYAQGLADGYGVHPIMNVKRRKTKKNGGNW